MESIRLNYAPWAQPNAGASGRSEFQIDPEDQRKRDEIRKEILRQEIADFDAKGDKEAAAAVRRELSRAESMTYGGAPQPAGRDTVPNPFKSAAPAPAATGTESISLGYAPWKGEAPPQPRGKYDIDFTKEAPKVEGRGLWATVTDPLAKIASSVPRAGSSLLGVVGLVPGLGEVTDKGAAYLEEIAKSMDAAMLSAQQQGLERELQERLAKHNNFWDQAKEAASFLAEHPGQIPMQIAGSAGDILAGGVYGRGIKVGAKAAGLGVRAGTAAAAGEGLQIAGGVSSDIGQGGGSYGERLGYSTLAGLTGFGTGRLGSKLLGESDVDTAITRRIFGREAAEAADAPVDMLRPAQSLTRRVATGVVGEGVLEEAPQSFFEQGFTNLGLERRFLENTGGATVRGAAAGSAMGGGFAMRRPSDTFTPAEAREAMAVMANPRSSPEESVAAADYMRRVEAFTLGREESDKRFASYVNDLMFRMDMVQGDAVDLLSKKPAGLEQVETRPFTPTPSVPERLGRQPRLIPVPGIPNLMQNTQTGNYEVVYPEEEQPLQRVTTQRPVPGMEGMTVDESGIYRVAQPQAPVSLGAPSAASPGVTTPPGVFSTPAPLTAAKTTGTNKGKKTPKAATGTAPAAAAMATPGAHVSAPPAKQAKGVTSAKATQDYTAALEDALELEDQAADDTLTGKVVAQVNSEAAAAETDKSQSEQESRERGVLYAGVQGAKRVRAPGRVTLPLKALTSIRDALLSKTGKIRNKTFAKNQKQVDALRKFSSAYRDFLSQSTTLRTQTTRRTGDTVTASADVLAKLGQDVRAALAGVGAAFDGNAKDVEAVVRVVKDAVQRKLAAPGKSKKATLQAMEAVDAMLSGGWAAAKRETFMGETADLADVSGMETRQSVEQQEKNNVMSQLETAATDGYLRHQLAAGQTKQTEWEAPKTGLLGVLQYLSFNTTPMGKAIAQAVIAALEGRGQSPKIVFSDTEESRYSPGKDTVFINRKEQSAEVALHEALHGALQWFVYKYGDTAEIKPIMAVLQSSLKSALAAKGLTGKALEVQQKLQELVKKKQGKDAVLELMSYNATLNDFRKAMQQLKGKDAASTFAQSVKRIWANMKMLVQKFLGVKPSVASDIMAATMELLEKSSLNQYKKPEALEGADLRAAVQSGSAPAVTRPSGSDFTSYANKNSWLTLPMRFAFEVIGLGQDRYGKDLKLTRKIKEKGAAVTKKIMRDMPGTERFLRKLNTQFGMNSEMRQAREMYRSNAHQGIQIVDKMRQFLFSQPQNWPKLMAYLDGDAGALRSLNDNGRMKELADSLKNYFDKWVESMPAEDPARKFFEDTKKSFSEKLIAPEKISQVAGTTYGLSKIKDMIGTVHKAEDDIDAFLPWLTKSDGTVEMDKLYQVFRFNKENQLEHDGFMSQEYFDKNGEPKDRVVDRSQTWSMSSPKGKGGKYRFTTRMTVADAVRQKNYEVIETALVNTVAALSHNFASREHLQALTTIGLDDNGKRTARSVAFESLEQINKAFPDRIVRPDEVIKTSDPLAASPRIKSALQATGTWVRIPENKETYGPLAGMYVAGPAWSAILDAHDKAPAVNIRLFNDAMRAFKDAKTTKNPATHVNNIGTNITLSFLHGIPPSAVARAARLYALYEAAPGMLNKDELKQVTMFISSGAMLGGYISTEAKETLHKAFEKTIRADSDSSVLTKLTSFAAYEKAKMVATKANRMTQQIYDAEDNVFRLAAFMNTAGNIQKREGTTTLSEAQLQEAGQAARQMFLDYDIDARAVRAARQTALPFISWTYAIIPVLGRIAIYKPWAMANTLLAIGLLSMAMGDGDEDDEELRAKGPEHIRQRAWGGLGPHMFVRLPGDDLENPLYMNMGRFNPMFSLTEPAPGKTALAGLSFLPGFLSPSGPYAGLLWALSGYDPFTGKAVREPTNTDWDNLVGTAKAVYDVFAPPAVNSDFLKGVRDLADDKKTVTGREPDTLFLARKLLGLGVYGFNVEEQQVKNAKALKAIQRDFKSAMNKAARDEYAKGYPDYEAMDEELADLRERMLERMDEVTGEEEE